MKVLDLKCAQQHVFEGWFGSEADFQDQLAKGLVECPLCGSADVQKQLSAPRLNLGARPPEGPFASPRADSPSPSAAGGSASGSASAGPGQGPSAQGVQPDKAAQALTALSSLANSPESAQAL